MWIIVAIALAIFVIPDPWGWPVIGLGVIVEVVETFVWIRLLHRLPPRAGADVLLGALARVTRACRPIGEVRVNGETWRARCDVGAEPGQRVRVRGRDGLTLVVEPAAEPS